MSQVNQIGDRDLELPVSCWRVVGHHKKTKVESTSATPPPMQNKCAWQSFANYEEAINHYHPGKKVEMYLDAPYSISFGGTRSGRSTSSRTFEMAQQGCDCRLLFEMQKAVYVYPRNFQNHFQAHEDTPKP